jgi:hypothetical protein
MNERGLFLEALDKGDAERAAFLNVACGEDRDLRARVEALLASHQEAGSFLGWPAIEPTEDAVVTPDGSSETSDAGATALREAGLDFLAPPLREGSLGRLDQFEVLGVVGQGGMGIVLRAFDEKLHRVVALKVMAKDFTGSGAARKRFTREAKAAAAVVHDHIVPIHGIHDEGPVPYLVMQFIEGKSLQQKIDEEGSLELREILRIGLQAAWGLEAAHRQGVVHRDIKPANLLLENGVQRVKITDFGLARLMDNATVSQSGVVSGTPQYMSPEQADGQTVDHRSDLFSLGSVLYAMCTGRPPFRAAGTVATLKRVCEATPRPIRELNPDIPEWLCEVIGKLHAKQPGERYQTAQEVAELLEEQLSVVQQGGAVSMRSPVKVPQAPVTALAAVDPEEILERERLPWRIVAWVLALGGIAVLRFTRGYETLGIILCFAGATLLLQSVIARLQSLFRSTEGSASSEAIAPSMGSKPTPGHSAPFKVWRFLLTCLGLLVAGVALFLVQDHLPLGWLAIVLAIIASLTVVQPALAGRLTWRQLFTQRPILTSLAISVFLAVVGGAVYLLTYWASGPSDGGGVERAGPFDVRPEDNLILNLDDERLSVDVLPEGGGVHSYRGDGKRKGFKLEPGRYQVQAMRMGTQVFQRWITIQPEEKQTLDVDSSWVQLFNGRDLTEWKGIGDSPENWRVQHGVLSCKTYAPLQTGRENFRDFHVRVEARISRAGSLHVYAGNPTVFLEHTGVGFYPPTAKDDWQVYEMSVRGDEMASWVNGRIETPPMDRGRFKSGPIALSCGSQGGVEIRRIEIKELGPVPMSQGMPTTPPR